MTVQMQMLQKIPSLLHLCISTIACNIDRFVCISDLPCELRDELLMAVLTLNRVVVDTDILRLLDSNSSVFALAGRQSSDQIFTPRLVRFLTENCTQLNVLRLEHVTSLTEDVLTQLIVNNCGSLRELNVSYCPKVSGGKFLSAVPRCHALISLILNGYVKFNDALLEPIAQQCVQLEKLELRGTSCSDAARFVLYVIQSIYYLLMLHYRTFLNTCSQLQDIDLGQTKIPDTLFLKPIIQQLRHVRIPDTSVTCITGLHKVLRSFYVIY